VRNPSGLLDFSLGEFIIHFFLFFLPFFPHSAHRENQHESSAASTVSSTPAPVPPPYPTSVILRVMHGGLTYVYEYLLLARAGLFLAFRVVQHFLANLTRTS